MNTRHLQYFVAAAECGSFTHAAERMYTTQPSFSKQIAALEDELGVRLFYREHRSVSLTEAGRQYYELVKDIPSILKQAEEQAMAVFKAENQELRIGVLEGHQLSPETLSAVEAFRARHGDVQIRFLRGDFDTLRDALLSHRVDVVFTIGFTLERAPGAQRKVLKRQASHIAVSRRNPLAEMSSVSLSSLRRETFVIVDKTVSPVSYHNLSKMLANEGISPDRMILVDSSESLFTSVEAGLGIAIVDGENRLKYSENAVLIPLEGESASPDLCAAWLLGSDKKHLIEFVNSL